VATEIPGETSRVDHRRGEATGMSRLFKNQPVAVTQAVELASTGQTARPRPNDQDPRRGHALTVPFTPLLSPDDNRCAACASSDLKPHLAVAGDAGPQGLIPTTDRFGTALADIVRCRSCGHMQLARFPSEAELAAAYGSAESQVYLDEEAGQRATAQAALGRIERHAAPGSLLDLGCWVGFLLAEARARGWRTMGVEPSRFASELARRRLRLEVQTADLFTAQLPPRSFDAIVLGDVLEHLRDPGGALNRIASLCAPRGLLYMTLPDAGSRVARGLGRRWWSVIPTHVQYFTRPSLRTLLLRHGWELLEIGTAPKAFSIGYYLARISGYSRRSAQALLGTARALGVADRLWAPDFGDRMAVLARGPEHLADDGLH
jgi:SAM-dependent methyltransferase